MMTENSRLPILSASARVFLGIVAGLWAAWGLYVVGRLVWGLAAGTLQATPEQVHVLMTPILVHVAIPCILLVLLFKK